MILDIFCIAFAYYLGVVLITDSVYSLSNYYIRRLSNTIIVSVIVYQVVFHHHHIRRFAASLSLLRNRAQILHRQHRILHKCSAISHHLYNENSMEAQKRQEGIIKRLFSYQESAAGLNDRHAKDCFGDAQNAELIQTRIKFVLYFDCA